MGECRSRRGGNHARPRRAANREIKIVPPCEQANYGKCFETTHNQMLTQLTTKTKTGTRSSTLSSHYPPLSPAHQLPTSLSALLHMLKISPYMDLPALTHLRSLHHGTTAGINGADAQRVIATRHPRMIHLSCPPHLRQYHPHPRDKRTQRTLLSA